MPLRPPQLPEFLAWRLREGSAKFRTWLINRGPGMFIAAHWPWPLQKPFERRSLRLTSCGGGIGDEMMCASVMAEIKRRNPNCHITFYSRHSAFFSGHPGIDSAEPWRSGIRGAIELSYPQPSPPRPLMVHMAECVGMRMTAGNLIPPPLPAPSAELATLLASIQKPQVVIQPVASGWTPNKQWPLQNWEALVRLLVESVDVIEVGTESVFKGLDFGPRFHSLAGKTDMAGFANVIRHADVFVGPSSGGMHVANAFKVPSVIVFGGYESPSGYNYENVTAFDTNVPCAPCWLTTPCPYDLKCLRAISPEAIRDAVVRALDPSRPAF